MCLACILQVACMAFLKVFWLIALKYDWRQLKMVKWLDFSNCGPSSCPNLAVYGMCLACILQVACMSFLTYSSLVWLKTVKKGKMTWFQLVWSIKLAKFGHIRYVPCMYTASVLHGFFQAMPLQGSVRVLKNTTLNYIVWWCVSQLRSP
jgi:hypothetical protein